MKIDLHNKESAPARIGQELFCCIKRVTAYNRTSAAGKFLLQPHRQFTLNVDGQ